MDESQWSTSYIPWWLNLTHPFGHIMHFSRTPAKYRCLTKAESPIDRLRTPPLRFGRCRVRGSGVVESRSSRFSGPRYSLLLVTRRQGSKHVECSGHFVSTAARAIIDGTPAPTQCDNCHAQTVPDFKHEVWDCTALQDRHTAVPTTTLQAALAWPAPQLSTQQNTDVLIRAAGIRARLLEQRYNG